MTRPSAALLATLTLAAGLAACQPAEEPEEGQTRQEQRRAVMATLDSMRADFEAAVAAGDFEEQASFYTSDAIYSPPGTAYVQGRDSIRALLEKTTPPGATLEIRPLETRFIGDDWLYEMGIGTLSFTPEGSEGPRRVSSTYLALFRSTPDGWRIHREVLSPNAAPGPAGE